MSNEYQPFRNLKLLIPFLEAQGFKVVRGVDHISVYPHKNSKVEVKIDGAQVLKDLEGSIRKVVLDGVDQMIKKCESLKNNLEGK